MTKRAFPVYKKARASRSTFFPQTTRQTVVQKRHGELRDDLFRTKISETTFFHDVFFVFYGETL